MSPAWQGAEGPAVELTCPRRGRVQPLDCGMLLVALCRHSSSPLQDGPAGRADEKRRRRRQQDEQQQQ